MAVLLGMQHLTDVGVMDFDLMQSHVDGPWLPGAHLRVTCLGVDHFARLPLERIPACTWFDDPLIEDFTVPDVVPSSDAQAVARVVEAVGRWGGLGEGNACSRFDGSKPAALFTTLRPLLEALPPAQRQHVCILYVNASRDMLRTLGQQLLPDITTLELRYFGLTQGAWQALLPSLPATVTTLRLRFGEGQPCTPSMDKLVALCAVEVRPVQVAVYGLSPQARQSVRRRLMRPAGQELVTLVDYRRCVVGCAAVSLVFKLWARRG